MPYVADLHIHSRFARACSGALNIPNLAKWAKFKGIDLVGTGDCLHPLWQAELKKDLKEVGNGIYEYNRTKFLLTTEVACIYTEAGKSRRIHTLIFLPSLDTVARLSETMRKRGLNLSSDGRPIFGLSSKKLCDIVFSAEPQAIIIPAHCLLPATLIHTRKGMQPIEQLKSLDEVYTHLNRVRKIEKVLNHTYNGSLYQIKPWYFSLGTSATSEHPFYALRIKQCPQIGDKCLPSVAHKKVCKHKLYEQYFPEWIQAKDLTVNDYLVYPRFKNTTLLETIPLDPSHLYKVTNNNLITGGNRGNIFLPQILVNRDFCRLIGYYLAEGYTNGRDEVGFAFHSKETDYVEDVIRLMNSVFGLKHHRTYQRKTTKGIEISFYSKVLVNFFSGYFYTKKPFRAFNKTIPDWMLHFPEALQAELLRGWWRGDKGSTTSQQLMNCMKVICLRLGIIPAISEDSLEKHLKRGNHSYKNRVIQAQHSLFIFNELAFFEDPYSLLEDTTFKEQKRKLTRRHGWIDQNYVYLPIRVINRTTYKGDVYNLEVEEDHSYLTEFSAVHNCWTPWFSLYGSNSGYDKFSDCYGDFSDQIYAVETGLSSEPAMNWRIKDLDHKSIVSFSDLHSLPRMGREVTLFKGQPTYEGLLTDLKKENIVGTIEFFPEEGKYHYSGHRNCNIVLNPAQMKTNGKICPVCNRPLTVGVMQRVEELATRSEQELELEKIDGVTRSKKFPNRPGFRMLVQLEEILAEAMNSTVSSQKVKTEYERLVTTLDSELKILTKTPIDLISMTAGEKVAEGVKKVRTGDIHIEPGYDNTYGVVKIWKEAEEKYDPKEQISLF